MYKSLKYFLLLLGFTAFVEGFNLKKKVSPPHCTQVSKDTDYQSFYKMDYPVAYILPGQHEAYQKMYCINPPTVQKAVTTVCDWAAPPQVQFTLGDDFVHVVRQDPTGRFQGNAVINTYQLCGHNISLVETEGLYVTESGNEVDTTNDLPVCLLLWCYSDPCANGPVNIPNEEITNSHPVVLFNDTKYKIYEYGKHEQGERLSFKYLEESIPAFHPIAVLNASSEYPELRPEFTYLRVDYRNSWSPVNVFYDPETYTINVHIKFPFVATDIAALGYFLPK